jgi:hypothetical protein
MFLLKKPLTPPATSGPFHLSEIATAGGQLLLLLLLVMLSVILTNSGGHRHLSTTSQEIPLRHTTADCSVQA